MQQIFKVTNVGAIEQITSKKDGSTTMQQRAEKANLVGASQVKRDPSDDSRSVCVKRDQSKTTKLAREHLAQMFLLAEISAEANLVGAFA